MSCGDPPVHTCTAGSWITMLSCTACTGALQQPYTASRAAAAWECPRCHVVNGPHVDRCSCAPAVAPAPAPTEIVPSPFGVPFTITCTTDNGTVLS